MTLRRRADRMAGAPDPLQQAGDRPRRTQLADEIDIADVDAELERCGRDQGAKLAEFQTLLGGEAMLLRHAAVMGRHGRLAEPFGECAGHALRHAARVDEDQGGAMGLDQLLQLVIDAEPGFRRHHGFQRLARDLDHQFAVALVAGIDDAHLGRTALRARAGEQVHHRVDRLLRRRETDAQELVAAECRETFERERQMHAALVPGHGVNFVDDHPARGLQHLPAGYRAEQDVEGFRRGDDDMRRPLRHLRAFGRRCVAGTDPGADLDIRQAALFQRRADAGDRRFEILLDVVGERLQGRDIDDLRRIGERAVEALAHQPVDRREEGGERLARPRRCGDQRVLARLDRRPGLRLRRCGLGKMAREPVRDSGMKQVRGQHCRGSKLHGEVRLDFIWALRTIWQQKHPAVQHRSCFKRPDCCRSIRRSYASMNRDI